MSRYAKNLSGQSEKVIVVPAAAAGTASATYAAFVASADIDGTIGFFLADGTLKTTLQAAGESIFVAQKRDGQVHRTPIWKFEDILGRREQLFVAPVKQITSVGFNTTVVASDLFGATPFATATASNTLTFALSVRETTPGNQPFPVQEGYATVNSSTADQYTVLAAIVSQLNADLDYQRLQPDRFVIAEIQQSSTTTAITVAATLAVVNGSRTITFNAAPTGAPVAGEYIAIGGTGQSGAVYKITAIPTTTVYTIDRPFTGATNAALAIANVLKAPFVNGTSKLGVRYTAILNESTFVASGQLNASISSPVLTTTSFVLGAGYDANIIELEAREGAIFEGVGSTANAAFAADYGQPQKFAVTGGQYDQWFLDVAQSVLPSAVPTQYHQRQIMRVHFAIEDSSAAAGTSGVVADVLGLG
jgi:hypothetical protein